jgi:hypothetical protein
MELMETNNTLLKKWAKKEITSTARMFNLYLQIKNSYSHEVKLEKKMKRT